MRCNLTLLLLVAFCGISTYAQLKPGRGKDSKGHKRAIILRVDFANNRIADVNPNYLNENDMQYTMGRMRDYLTHSSRGAITMDWVTFSNTVHMPNDAGSYGTGNAPFKAIQKQVTSDIKAYNAAWSPLDVRFEHVVLFMMDISPAIFGWLGMASLPESPLWAMGISNNPPADGALIWHEVTHTFGLYSHGDLFIPGTNGMLAPDGDITECQNRTQTLCFRDMGDVFEPMGSIDPSIIEKDLQAYYKYNLQILDDAEAYYVENSNGALSATVYPLSPHDDPNRNRAVNKVAVSVERSDLTLTYYGIPYNAFVWVSYRRAIKKDLFPNQCTVTEPVTFLEQQTILKYGAIVHQVYDPLFANTQPLFGSMLIDTTPYSRGTYQDLCGDRWSDYLDAPLLVGRSISIGNIHITNIGPNDVEPTYLDVAIHQGPTPYNPLVINAIETVRVPSARSALAVAIEVCPTEKVALRCNVAGNTQNLPLAYYWDFGEPERWVPANCAAPTYSWLVGGVHRVTCEVSDHYGNKASYSVLVKVRGPQTASYQATVTQEESIGTILTNYPAILLNGVAWDGNTYTYTGLRFEGVGVDKAVSFTSAYVQFQNSLEFFYDSNALNVALPVTFTLYLQLGPGANLTDCGCGYVWGCTCADLSKRPRTLASVDWAVPVWTAGYVVDSAPDFRTPDITTLINEVVNQPSWMSGGAIVLLIKVKSGSGVRLASSYTGTFPSLNLNFADDTSCAPWSPPTVIEGLCGGAPSPAPAEPSPQTTAPTTRAPTTRAPSAGPSKAPTIPSPIAVSAVKFKEVPGTGGCADGVLGPRWKGVKNVTSCASTCIGFLFFTVASGGNCKCNDVCTPANQGFKSYQIMPPDYVPIAGTGTLECPDLCAYPGFVIPTNGDLNGKSPWGDCFCDSRCQIAAASGATGDMSLACCPNFLTKYSACSAPTPAVIPADPTGGCPDLCGYPMFILPSPGKVTRSDGTTCFCDQNCMADMRMHPVATVMSMDGTMARAALAITVASEGCCADFVARHQMCLADWQTLCQDNPYFKDIDGDNCTMYAPSKNPGACMDSGYADAAANNCPATCGTCTGAVPTAQPTASPTMYSAQLHFGDQTTCSAGSATFKVNLPAGRSVWDIGGYVPVGKFNVRIDLSSAYGTLNLGLYDMQWNSGKWPEGQAIVAYCDPLDTLCNKGMLGSSQTGGQGTYSRTGIQPMVVYYSGNAGASEYITIDQTTAALKVRALAYVPGQATVTYSWGTSKSGCCLGTTACVGDAITRDVTAGDMVIIGDIPVGKKNINITLSGDADLDIRVFDLSDKAFFSEGLAIVGWCPGKCNYGQLRGAKQASITIGSATYTYSGYNGYNGKTGNEFFRTSGVTDRPLRMAVYAFSAGRATVNYNYSN